jgi:hypothetical protein
MTISVISLVTFNIQNYETTNKRFTNKMDALAIQPVLHPSTQDTSIGNDHVGSVAMRDYPEDSPMLL